MTDPAFGYCAESRSTLAFHLRRIGNGPREKVPGRLLAKPKVGSASRPGRAVSSGGGVTENLRSSRTSAL
jgi:hypothetical protein